MGSRGDMVLGVILNWLCHQEHMVAQESVVSQSERQEKKEE